jgi:hypothetical protein
VMTNTRTAFITFSSTCNGQPFGLSPAAPDRRVNERPHVI